MEAPILLGSGEAFSWPVFSGGFVAMLFSVYNHLGGFLGAVLRGGNFANFCLTPIFMESPNGSFRFRPHTASRRGA